LKPQLKDAVLVQLIRNSGAIPFCKTNVPWHLLFNEASNPIFGKSKSNKHNISLGGRAGALALLASTHLSMVGFGTDQAGGLRNPASHAGVFTLKPTSQRISSLTNVSLYDSIPSTPGPISSSIDTLTFIYQALLTKDIQSQDPSLFPIPFNTQLYGETLRSKKLTVGIYVDDQIVRACPSARRAVFLAATALHSKGHNVVRFHPPSTDKAFLLLSKLFAYEKLNLPCMKAGFTQQTTILSNIFPMYTFAKIPKTFKTILFFLFGIGMKDSILKNLSYSYGGGSGKKARSLEEYNSLIEEKEEYRRLFTSAWQNPEMDCLICPINACSPNMPCTSTPFTLSGSFYSSLYNLLDYPSGYVPHVTHVQPDDQITNIVQYAHNDRYIPRSDRDFKFLSVMALEEVNNCIQNETILGSDIGVQVVGKPFEEEKVLAVMKMLSQSLSD
jgi:fatty acid amide hydrolase